MPLIETTNLKVTLTPKPIEPSWIIEGNPVARGCVLSKSADRLAFTMVWECSEGKFNWYYDFDETIMILEGSIVLESDAMRPTRYGPGDVIFFRNGAHARWHVEGRVRKLAFCRTTQPFVLGLVSRALSKIRRILMPSGKVKSASLVGATAVVIGRAVERG
ncbi:MAG TPA: cupin domain-containing protein [Bradyrhizobium sp.]|nr:cupin domain-containing protein [Bradyrhizobium sp.]